MQMSPNEYTKAELEVLLDANLEILDSLIFVKGIPPITKEAIEKLEAMNKEIQTLLLIGAYKQ